MKTKPKTPYARLMEDIKEFCVKVRYRHTVCMWWYPKDKLDVGWALSSLYERVQAADQLGYEVVLRKSDEGLSVYYVKKNPDIPWNW